MKTKILATGAIAASVVAGSVGLSVISPLGLAGAQDDDPPAVEAPLAPEELGDRPGPRAHLLEEALDNLVADGTITQDEADAVVAEVQALAEARREERQAERQEHLADLAEILGMTPDEVAEALRGGQTIAELAGDSVDEVIDALVAEATERIEAAVAEGRLTQERADEMLANLEEHITDRVNGELPLRPGHGGHRGFGPGAEGGGFGPGSPFDD